MKKLALCVAVSACLNISYAAETAVDSTPVEEIVVSASRLAQPLSRVIGDVSVITRAQIDAAAPNDMAELIGRLPGIDVVRSGSFGSQTSVFMRGAESDHVLVLVDGVRVNSPTVGVAAWADLHPSQIERIEVVRGARSAVYGSDAIAGVVQIFTRKADHAAVTLRAGSFGTTEATLTAGSKSERGYAGITLNRLESDGYSAQNANADMPASAFGPAYNHDPDDDGIERNSFSAKAGISGAQWALDVSAQSTDADIEIDSSFGSQQSASDQDTLALQGSYDLSENSQAKLLLGYNGQESGDTDADRRSAELSIAYAPEGTHWLLGAGTEDINGKTASYDRSVYNHYVFAQALAEYAAVDWQLALRLDDHENFGSHTSGSVAAGWWLSEAVRLSGSYAQGFRAPTLDDLFSPGFGGTFAGNPDLAPEESENTELGVKWLVAADWQLSANLFYTDFKNLIAFQGANFQAVNVAEASVKGAELSASYTGKIWFAELAITLQRARDENDAPLLRRPDEKATLILGRHWQAVTAELDVKVAGESEDFGATLDGYEVVGASLSWDVNSQLLLSVRAENLLDENYQVANGFNTTPRSGYLTARYQF